MGIFRKLFGANDGIDIMRVDIYMDYRSRLSFGNSMVEWTPLNHYHPDLRLSLVVLHYARILCVHSETRSELYNLINDISKQNVLDKGQSGFQFPDWNIDPGMGVPEQKIWPWDIYSTKVMLQNPKIYSATLRAIPETDVQRHFQIHLKMAFGLERILAPSSVLILITSFLENADNELNYELALWLWQINEFYRTPNSIRRGSESKALIVAENAIRSGNLNFPQ